MNYIYIPTLNAKYYPLSLTLRSAELNEELQHVEAYCDARLEFEPVLFRLLCTQKNIPAVIKKDEDNTVVFSGIIRNDISWSDEGNPTPISDIQVRISDNSYLLEKKTAGEISIISSTLKAVVQKLATDCNITVADYSDTEQVNIQAFVLDKDKQYLTALNAVLFQHCYFFKFDENGHLVVSKLSEIPENQIQLTNEDFYTAPKISKSSKNYDKVNVKYNTLTKKRNEQVYFAGNDLDSESHIIPITLRPGQYYPYESDPVQEAREGKVQQTFESGYAESYTTYSGETKYRRSQKTTLLYTENHYVVQDWAGSIVIDRTEFGSRQASVRLRNTSATQDAQLYQLAIRADAYYRTADCSVACGTGSNEFTYESEYIYSSSVAENLARLLSRFFINTSFKISGAISRSLPVGSYVKVDTGDSGFICNCLVLACSYDEYEQKYSVSLVSYGDVSVDITRSQYQSSVGDSNYQIIDSLITGSESTIKLNIPAARIPQNLVAIASKDSITLSCTFANNGISTASKIIWAIKKPSQTWDSCIQFTSTFDTFYQFNRASDGFPEASALSDWQVRAKSINSFNKQSEWSESIFIDVSNYGTWIPQLPDVSVTEAKRLVSMSFKQPQRSDLKELYGELSYGILIRKSSDSQWYTPATDLDPTASEENYKDNTSTEVVVSNYFSQSLPLVGQNLKAYKCYSYTVYPGEDLKKNQKTVYKSNLDDYSIPSSADIVYDSDGRTILQVSWNINEDGAVLYFSCERVDMPSPQDTPYLYKISVTNKTTGVRIQDTKQVSATARANSIGDIVANAITANMLAPDAVTADKIAAGTITAEQIAAINLAANGAMFGDLSAEGFKIDGRNFWAGKFWQFIDEYTGQTITANKGQFWVGGKEEYIHINPVINTITGQITGYTIEFKVGNFSVSSQYSSISGELTIQKNSDSLDRTRITPNGTYYEHRETVSSSWKTINKMDTNGILSSQLFSQDSLFISNQNMAQRRLQGFDIGNAYLSQHSDVFHFDTDVYNQSGIDKLTIVDEPDTMGHELVGADSNSDDIDFTPAILAVAPYSTIGRSLYGRYSAQITYAATNIFTVDFWIQYIYAENQEIFRIGTLDDKVILKIVSAEPYFEEGGEIPFNAEINETRMYNKLEEQNCLFFSPDEELPFCMFDTNNPTPFESIAKKEFNNSYSYYAKETTDDFENYVSKAVTAIDYYLNIRVGLYERTIPFNTPADAHSYILHQGQTSSEQTELEELGVSFRSNEWLHIGIICQEQKICVALNNKKVCFDRYALSAEALDVILNQGRNSFILDELLIDTTVSEDIDMFYEHTVNRIPWAALDKSENYFILSAANKTNFKTNIFDTDIFKAKVLEIVNEQ